MSAKHTPGPWTQGTSKIGLTCVWLDGMTEQRDGKGLGPENTWIDCNTEANASLIAAAPDLLEALKACRLELFHCNQQLSGEGYTTGKTVSDALEQARTAIAKAIG